VDQAKRENYNKERAEHIRRGELVQNDLGEDFAGNAFDGDDSEGDDDEDDEPQPMSEAKKKTLDSMGPLVERVLMSGDEEAYKELEKLMKEMQKLNKKENKDRNRNGQPPVPVSDRTPPLQAISNAGEHLRIQLAILNDPNQDTNVRENAKREYESKKAGLKDLLEVLLLPPWANSLPNPTAPSAASQRSGAGNGQTGNPQTSADRSTDQPSSDAMDTTYPWTPGQTKKGKKILAYSPRTATGRSLITGQPEQICTGAFFVIQVEEANPIKILKDYEVGYEAAAAYIGLPEDRKCNITGIQKQYTRMHGYATIIIKGVAHNPHEITYQKLPTGVLWIEYNGENRMINRQAFRNMMGARRADHLVDEFLVGVNEDPKTLKKGLALEQANNPMLLEQHGSREPNNAHLRNGNSRRGRFGGSRDVAFNTPREPHGQTSTPLREPTPVRTAPPAQHPSRTSITNTLPGTVREEQRQTGAVADQSPDIEARLSRMMQDMMLGMQQNMDQKMQTMLQEFATSMTQNMMSQNSTPTTQ
jgi:hypothetical protein